MKTRLTSPLLLAAVFAALSIPSAPSSAQQLPDASLHAGLPVTGAANRPSKRDLITAREVRESTALNAHELIGRHRPAWLRQRGKSSLFFENPIVVYRDGMRFGGPESLRQIEAYSIKSVRFLNGVDATLRFGTGHGNGVIFIESK